MLKQLPRSPASEDLIQGQDVIIAARWVLILAGLMLSLWNPGDLVDLQVAIALILGLSVSNFALQAQIMKRGPVVEAVVQLASVADIAVISLLIMTSDLTTPYVFYLPALLAISVTFHTEVTAAFALGTTAAYSLIATAMFGAEVATVAVEALMLLGVAVCGNMYWRLERERREGSRSVEMEVLA